MVVRENIFCKNTTFFRKTEQLTKKIIKKVDIWALNRIFFVPLQGEK